MQLNINFCIACFHLFILTRFFSLYLSKIWWILKQPGSANGATFFSYVRAWSARLERLLIVDGERPKYFIWSVLFLISSTLMSKHRLGESPYIGKLIFSYFLKFSPIIHGFLNCPPFCFLLLTRPPFPFNIFQLFWNFLYGATPYSVSWRKLRK